MPKLKNIGLNIDGLLSDCGFREDGSHQSKNAAATKTAKVLEDLMAIEESDNARKHLRLKPSDFSLKELYEAVDVTQFPILTSVLISRQVLDAYNLAAKIGDQLVTPFTSNQQIDKVPGAFLKGDMNDIVPGAPYQHTGDIEEKYIQIAGGKRGAIIDISEEAVLFDQTGLILRRASLFGERAALDREKHIIYTILDETIGGKNYYSWYPGGSRSANWQNAQGAGDVHEFDNLVDNILADFTDIAAADLLLGLMKDENGDPIIVDDGNLVLLVPRTLKTTALRLINNEFLPGISGSSIGNLEKNPYNNQFTILSTPLIDGAGHSNATTNWWLGNFKKQFLEKVVYPIQVKTRRMGDNNEDAWQRDVFASFKVRRWSQVGATDYRYVVKSDGTA